MEGKEGKKEREKINTHTLYGHLKKICFVDEVFGSVSNFKLFTFLESNFFVGFTTNK